MNAVPDRSSGRSWSPVPLLLLLLALSDLRTELQLLVDHPTLTQLFHAVMAHPLAIVVLITQPSLWRHYRRQPGKAGTRLPG